MITVLGFLLFAICLAIHEISHAYEMQKNGVQMDEICLFGIGGPKVISFKVKYFGETPITVRPFVPLGAFVKQTGDISTFSKSNQVDIYAAGIITNMYFGAGLLLVASFLNWNIKNSVLIVSAIVAMYILFRIVKARLIMALGLLSLSFVLFTIFTNPNGMGSVVAISNIILEQRSILDSIVITAFISISIAIFNTAPFLGLDGHKIMLLYIPKRFHTTFNVVSGIGMIAVIIISLGNDILSFF